MRLLAYSVYDLAVKAYLTPFFMRSRGEAVRSFKAAVGDPKTPFCANPEDFFLAEIGEFDDGTGMFSWNADHPVKVISALELVNVNGSVDLGPASERSIPVDR